MARRGFFTLTLSLAACAVNGGASVSTQPHQKMAFYARAANAPAQAPPALPAGWAWPFDVSRALAPNSRSLATNTVYRPINVTALRATRARAPNSCAPIEMAPSVWISPLCSPLAVGRAVVQQAGVPVRSLQTRAATILPASVDLRAMGLDGAIKEQQMAPVCWSFAFSTVMENALRRAGRADIVAPLHLVSHNDWHALKYGAGAHPTTLESTWAFDPVKACELAEDVGGFTSCQDAYGVTPGSGVNDATLVAEKSNADAASAYRISAIQPLASSPGNPDEMARVLAGGQSIYLEVEFSREWNNSFHAPGGVIPDWRPDGTGGHAVTLSGYGVVNGKRMFLLHNSWGPSWGADGYGWISEEMIRTRIRDAWTITLSDRMGNVVAPLGASPVPVPTPTVPVPTPTAPVPVPVPIPQSGGRTQCTLVGVHSDNSAVSSWRTLAVNDSVCTSYDGTNASPVEWLHVCHKVSSGAHRCSALTQTPACVTSVVAGHTRAACCPVGARSSSDPGCIAADTLVPKNAND